MSEGHHRLPPVRPTPGLLHPAKESRQGITPSKPWLRYLATSNNTSLLTSPSSHYKSYTCCLSMQLLRDRPTMGSQVYHLLDLRRRGWPHRFSPILLQIRETRKSTDRSIWDYRVMEYETIRPHRRAIAMWTRNGVEILDLHNACEGNFFLDLARVRCQRRPKWEWVSFTPRTYSRELY